MAAERPVDRLVITLSAILREGKAALGRNLPGADIRSSTERTARLVLQKSAIILTKIYLCQLRLPKNPLRFKKRSKLLICLIGRAYFEKYTIQLIVIR